jgi:hypothetical protein
MSKISLSKKIAFSLFLILFMYSGIDALEKQNRTRKITTLSNKINISNDVSKVLIIGGSVLEILCPLVIIMALFLYDKYFKSKVVKSCFYFLMTFMLVVTLIYYYNKPVPLLSNLSLLTGLIYTYLDIYH